MKAFKRTIGSIGLAIALGACVSTPVTHYYTLSPANPATQTRAPQQLKFDLQTVSVPVAVDRQEIVLRDGSGGLALLENERWSAPLSDEIRTALASSLARRLGAQDVSSLPVAAGAEILKIRVAVRRFDAIAGNSVTLSADWSLDSRNKSGKSALTTCSSVIEASAGNSVAAVVQAQQQNIETLAQRIEQGLRTQADSPPACPAD